MKYNKTILVICIILTLLFTCSLPNGHISSNGNSNNSNSTNIVTQTPNTDNEIIVKVSNNVSINTIDSLINGSREKTIANFNGYSYYLYKLSGFDSIDNIINNINSFKQGSVFAEKNQIYKIFLTPNDPNYPNQYAPKITNCESAWNITTGSSSVTVAVIDTGINGAHEDLTSRVIAGYNYVYGSSISAGANSDDHGHGTHVAGIIGAAGNNSKGIAGVAWQTNLMPVKVLNSSGSGTTSNIISGIIYASNNGANVINMSLGGTSYSQMMADAINYAVSTKNIVVVAAMGNDSCSMINYPAAYPGVIAVGSTNGRDQISSYSTTGNNISVSAPGENVYSLSYNNNSGYVYMSGTSMASPFVAGIAALLLANNLSLTPAQIKSMIEDSAVDKGTTGFDSVYGYGRVDVAAALNLTPRNNYGTIKATVLINNSIPVANIPILLLNSNGSQTIIGGLTSDGSGSVGTKGEIDFNFIHSGTYTIKAIYSGTTQTQNITLIAGSVQTVTFNYNVPTYTLNVSISPSNAGAIVLNPDGGIYIQNSTVTITANSNAGYIFDHWTGGLTGTSNPATITMNNNKTITAVFSVSNTYIIETFHNGGSTVDTVLYLYDNNLNQLAYNDDYIGLYSHISYTLTSAATYYIMVRGYSSSSTGYYSILLNNAGGGSSTNTPSQDAGEPDGTSGTAFIMSPNVVYDRYLTSGDQDWFKITLP